MTNDDGGGHPAVCTRYRTDETEPLWRRLDKACRRDAPPTVIAYNRIDGPGSTLDLREVQQSLWTMPARIDTTTEMEWSRRQPRTVGISIDTGTRIHAEPLDGDRIGVRSTMYDVEVFSDPGKVVPVRENWLLKVIELFGLRGVLLTLTNLQAGIQSSGLGGSATATVGVCLMCNELAGRPFNATQLIAMASRLEQDLDVSVTGTQEQSNVVFGGVTDYLWWPFGVPFKNGGGYGGCNRSRSYVQ